MQESIVFLVRVQCRCKESSRSLSHLLMSFLLCVCQCLPMLLLMGVVGLSSCLLIKQSLAVFVITWKRYELNFSKPNGKFYNFVNLYGKWYYIKM